MGIRDEMPLLARHEGEWHGTYRFVDPAGNVIDEHESRLRCTFPESGEFAYHQVNEYAWADGRSETLQFPAAYRDGAIHFDTDRMRGHAWEIDDRCIVLTWVYKADPEVSLYELIHLDEAGRHRTRTWHWFRAGVCFQRTLIDERKVS